MFQNTGIFCTHHNSETKLDGVPHIFISDSNSAFSNCNSLANSHCSGKLFFRAKVLKLVTLAMHRVEKNDVQCIYYNGHQYYKRIFIEVDLFIKKMKVCKIPTNVCRKLSQPISQKFVETIFERFSPIFAEISQFLNFVKKNFPAFLLHSIVPWSGYQRSPMFSCNRNLWLQITWLRSEWHRLC